MMHDFETTLGIGKKMSVFREHWFFACIIARATLRERDESGDREKGLTAFAATMKDLFRTSFG